MMKHSPISLLSLFFLLSITTSNLVSTTTLALSDNHSKFELIHRHSPHINNKHKTQIERIKDLVNSDSHRHHMISHKRRKTWETRSRSSSSSTVEMPLQSGAYDGAGQYFVGIKVGTPGQKFMLIADTGSDLTWMNCKYQCGSKCVKQRRFHNRRVFQSDRSSSFSPVSCFSDMCKFELAALFSLDLCPTPLSPCAYEYSYADGSAATGFFANETISLHLCNGRKTKLQNVVIGCTESLKGKSLQYADGVLGLGYSNNSFAVKASQNFGGIFSYCLVDHLSPQNVSNYLTFGQIPPPKYTIMQYTNLVLGLLPPFYAVNILGISFGGVMLNIPLSVWDVHGVGGTIVDSGTSLTILTMPAYEPVMAALKASLSKFEKLDLEIGPLEYCFNSTTGFDESLVPKLKIHFADRAVFEPPVKSYVIDTAPGVKCLGFVPTNWPGTSVIGNIIQQNHLWEFDLVQNRLGFAPSSCT